MAELDLRPNRITSIRPATGVGVRADAGERGRIARDLHDRLGRMLGHLDGELDRLVATGLDGEELRRLQHAARLAVDELRAVLRHVHDEPAGTEPAEPAEPGEPGEPGDGVIVLDDDRGGVALSERQIEILQAIAHGATTKQVARDLDITQKTVHNHLNAVYRRLGTQSLTHAVLSAVRLGIIALD